MADLFNNTSNDYINPTLAPCAGNADEYTFEFLPGQQVGIVSGSSIIAAMGLGDIQQGVEGWVTQTKILQPGEVTYISGLTKGITNEVQRFLYTNATSDGNDHSMYTTIDISINYYNNFRNYNRRLIASASPTNGINIANAFNILFSADGIPISVTCDASGITFEGSNQGFSFDITGPDASVWDPTTPFYGTGFMVEDTSAYVPAFKYPNGAMLGYVLKVTYSDTTQPENDFVMINHVPDYLEYFVEGPLGVWTRYYKPVDVGQSATCPTDTISSGEYLDWVQTNGKWEKVGVVKIWLTAVDPADSAVENLITGFYVFNPQVTAVKIDYMTIL